MQSALSKTVSEVIEGRVQPSPQNTKHVQRVQSATSGVNARSTDLIYPNLPSVARLKNAGSRWPSSHLLLWSFCWFSMLVRIFLIHFLLLSHLGNLVNVDNFCCSSSKSPTKNTRVFAKSWQFLSNSTPVFYWAQCFRPQKNPNAEVI